MTLSYPADERRRTRGTVLLVAAPVPLLASFVLPRIPRPVEHDPSGDGIVDHTSYFNLLPLTAALIGIGVLSALVGMMLLGASSRGGWIALLLVGLLAWGSWASLSPFLECWGSASYSIDFEDDIGCG